MRSGPSMSVHAATTSWILALQASAAGPVTYTVTEIDPLPGYTVMRPIGLNDAGQVAAFCSHWGNAGVGVGVLHTPGSPLKTLTTPALPVTNPVHLNEAGHVFGDTDPDGSLYGQPGRTLWRYSPGPGMQTLGIPADIARFGWITDVNNAGSACGGVDVGLGQIRGWTYSNAQGWRRAAQVHPSLDVHGHFVAINDAGHLAGVFDPPATSFLVAPGQVPVNIGHLGSQVTFVSDGAISDGGAVAGVSAVPHPTLGMIGRATRYSGGELVNLHTLSDEYWTVGYAINTAGMVAGTVQDGFGPYVGAFRYDDAAGMVFIQTPPAPYGLAAFGINEDGAVLGMSYGDPYNEPWVWTPGDGLSELRPYYDPVGNVNVMGFAVDINRSGQVLLFVMDLDAEVARALVLTPDSCYPDCSGDGALTVADFGCFQTRFVAGDPYADCNGDGQRTVADFGCFQTQFVAGCP